MANSKFEYVRSYECKDEVFEPVIVIHIQAYDFVRFSDTHRFEKPNDEKAVNLMNSCATATLEAYPDIIFGYGFSDEYSFVLGRKSTFHKRRASKILSLIGSFFTSVYVKRWKDHFGKQILLFPPSFQSRIIACASNDVLQAYLAWKQTECRAKNQRNICLSSLLKCGNIEKGNKNEDKYELLFQQFGLNHEELHDIFHQGSCVFRTEVEVIVKYHDNGIPIKRPRKMLQIVHHKNIASSRFWNDHSVLVKKLGSFQEEMNEVKPEYIKSFLFDKELIPSTWVVIRIDGHNFKTFSEVHEFEKPNDEQALNLMNSCAVAVLNEFRDIIFSYGTSDEYSFVLKKDSQFHQRRSSAIVSTIVSFFSSVYINNWKIFSPNKELKYLPRFDGRTVCYTSEKVVRDYLAWRQVDCHINNQFSTCFWMLVKSGKSEREAHDYLKGTRAQQKIELLAQQFGIDYYKLPLMFRKGSSVFWDMAKEEEKVARIDSPQTRKKEQEDEMMARVDNYRDKIVTEHCSIIEQDFWCAHPHILLG